MRGGPSAAESQPFARSGTLYRVAVRLLSGTVTVAIGAAIAIGLGMWGYSRLPGVELSGTDLLYRTLQLFNLDAELPAEGVPWQLDVARFLAPAVVAYALLVAAIAVAREAIQGLRVRFRVRDHVLIVGVGGRGSMLARRLRYGHRVVGVEIDSANGVAKSLRAAGVPVLSGDARDPETLAAARAEHAAHVVLLTGDDSTNLEVLAALRRYFDELAGSEAGAGRIPARHVAIDSVALWTRLNRVPLQAGHGHRRVEFFSLPDRFARMLVSEALGDAGAAAGVQTLVIDGVGPTVVRLAVHLARSAILPPGARLIFEGPDVDESLRRLQATEPWVEEVVEVSAGSAKEDADLAFVAGYDEAEALEAAMLLAPRIGSEGTVYTAVPDADAGRALAAAGVELARVRLVVTSATSLGPELLAGATLELIARGRHAEYLEQGWRRGDSPEQNPSMVAWEELDEKLRESNRAYAEDLAKVLDLLGLELAPLRGERGRAIPVSEEMLEDLARREHDRWVAEKRAQGFSYTEGPKDTERKLHPRLVPYDQLPEAEREKDRDGVRAIPELLALVGYEAVPREPGESAADV